MDFLPRFNTKKTSTSFVNTNDAMCHTQTLASHHVILSDKQTGGNTPLLNLGFVLDFYCYYNLLLLLLLMLLLLLLSPA